MKITCEYCGSMFDDTLEVCPACGAPNKNVRRSTADQPTTIEELQAWYASKGLPPYETTRFFIGENYQGAKAFGIYKEENSDKFVVYKNKADGSRAVRYEGTDEAFAVNEIFMRLKQEIIQQKAHNVANSGGNSQGSPAPAQKSSGRRRRKQRWLVTLLGIVIPLLLSIGLICGMDISEKITIPDKGYYEYKNEMYYHYSDSDQGHWARYSNDKGEWVDTTVLSSSELHNRKKAKKHYLGESWSGSLGVPDFEQSLFYDDYLRGYNYQGGYYAVGNDVYYFVPNYYGAWFTYDSDDDEWYEVTDSSLPPDLQHCATAEDFYFTPEWNESTQITDFEETERYEQLIEEQERYEEESRSTSSWDDDDDSDYSWDSDDSWDSGYTDWDSDW
jgi:hypothetical protein